MADFIFTGPSGEKFKVSGPTEAGAIAAFQKAMGGQQRQENVIGTTPDGGRFVKSDSGAIYFASPGYSTSDPETVKRLMDGAGIKDVVQSGFDQQTIAQHPIAARANEFVRGTPFVGSYADEAVGLVFPKARDAMRTTTGAMQREHPIQTGALNMAGAVATGVPMAMAGAPAVMAAAPKAPAAKAVMGGLFGALGGAGEGAVYGSGEGTGDERKKNAVQQGIFGGVAGGALGAALPLASGLVQSMIRRYKGEDVGMIAEKFGVSRDAARVLKTAFENNDEKAVDNILRAGSEATLADAGRSGQALIDAAAQTGGRPLNIVEGAVNARANRSLPSLAGALDDTLGAPQGPRAAARAVSAASAPARKEAYDAAFNTAIDYASPEGREVESLLGRIAPEKLQAATKIANERLRWDGGQAQILADIADDGSVSFRQMPGVRQLDELKKALNQLDQTGRDQFGRATDGGLAADQARAVRDATIEATGGDQSPYAAAVKLGGDKIEMDKGLELGLNMLRDTNKTTREMVSEQLAGMSADARQMVKVGLRSHIDETLGAVKMIASNPDAMEGRQAMQALRMLTSDNAKHKLKALLGPSEFAKVMPELDKAIATQNMVASVAQNSKTAVRGAIQGQVDDITAPGMFGTLARGKPLNATESLVQTLMATTPGDDAARQQGIWSEVAQVLTERKGNKTAEAALKYVNDAINGTALTEQQVKLIANQVLLGAGVATHQSGLKGLQ